jgi:uncharacterized lipoprotein YddW (UPF0748 family)
MRLVQVKKILPTAVALLLLVGAVVLSSVIAPDGAPPQGIDRNLFSSQQGVTGGDAVSSGDVAPKPQPPQEMRAVWVPFMTLDCKTGGQGEQAFREKFDAVIAKAQEYGINTLVVHVRSHGDAMYPSEYFPWSHLLTGTQGADPGFDPLTYMVEATHRAGMQFHAWVNPLRVQVNGTPSLLAENNPYRKWREDDNPENDDWVLDDGEDRYYNPAIPQVRALIIDGVKELVQKYAVDAIHFDDYFYPTTEASYDQKSYDAYCAQLGEGSKPLSQMDWRKSNINALVAGVYGAVKNVNPAVQFGISPQGNISNDLGMGADIYTWGSVKGYCDYLCPQIYVNFEHPLLPFDKTAEEWKALVSCPDVKLYLGLGAYKAGTDADNGTWKNGNDILKREIEFGREIGCDGFMIYSWESLNAQESKEEIENAAKIFTTGDTVSQVSAPGS